MNVKDNHKPMNLFYMIMKNFLYGHGKFGSDDSQFLKVPFNRD